MPPATSIKAARGTHDLMPADRAVWELVEVAAHEAARSFGYQEVATPILERRELIERGIGTDSDAGSKELYRLERRGDEELVLRPEGTAGMVRAYFQHHLDQGPQPARLYMLGPMFRYDRPQSGRFRQFAQFDVEAMGEPSAALDAEVIEIAMRWMRALGLSGLRLELNSIGDETCRPGYLEMLRAHFEPHRARLCAQCQVRLDRSPLRLLDCKEVGCAPFRESAPRMVDHLCEACANAYAEVRALLAAAGLEYVENPHLVRGLDYYTRTVFEIQHQSIGGAQNSLGGGGRYDGLAAALGYPEAPAVGFAAGVERVVMMMAAEGEEVIPPPAAQLLVIPVDDGLACEAAEVARLAREVVPAAVDYSSRSLKAKMRSANRLDPRWVALLDAEEATRRVVRLKEMAGGEQQELPWDGLAAALLAAM